MKKMWPLWLPLVGLMALRCQLDFSPLSPQKFVRTAADLSRLSIAKIDSAYSFYRAKSALACEWEQTYYIQFGYQWRKPPDRFITIEQMITESFPMAEAFLRYQWENSCIYHGQPRPQDQPPIAGTVSYQGGHIFIRDNIIIECSVRNDSSVNLSDLARMADELLLQGPLFDSPSAVKPVIRRFTISRNPVPLWTETPLFIDVVNPSGCGGLYYNWRFQPNFGGVLQDVDRYYFQSYIDNPMTIALRLIAFNSCGFFDWAEITIDIH